MKKSYTFLSQNNMSISIDEVQTSNDVNLHIQLKDKAITLPFDKEEFFELANMRYRLEFPVVATETAVMQ
jgi:hypothetical protein